MNMNEPKLRFKADDGSQFPEWEEKKLGEYLIQYTEKTTVNNQYPVLTSSRKGIYLQDDYYGRQVASENNIGYNIVPYGYFTYRHMSDDLIFRFNINNIVEKGIVSTLYPVFTVTDKIDSNFLQSYLNESIDFFKYCMLQKQGGSRTYMYFGKLKDFVAHLPCLPEQQKIAEFLSTIDTVIEKQKETVSAWEERKKGVMQKLFSQEVRFKADDGSEFPEWEEKKLGDICKTFSGGTPKSGEARYYENGTISFIRSGEIHDDKTELRITNDGLNESSAKMVDVGDILYALYGATSGEVDISKIKGAINQAILCIRPLNDFNRKFIVEILRHNKETILRTYLQGGQGNLSAQIIQSLVFDFPCFAEQQKIADCLSSLDEVIEKQKATLAAWEEMKKGLLQQMFV